MPRCNARGLRIDGVSYSVASLLESTQVHVLEQAGE